MDPALLEHWIEAFSETLETFSGRKHDVVAGSPAPPAEGLLFWQQSFHPPVGPALVIAMEPSAAPQFAAIMGIEAAGAEETRSTCGELLTNTGCHLAQQLGSGAGMDLDGYPGVFCEHNGAPGLLHEVKVSSGGAPVGRLWVGFTAQLSEFCQPKSAVAAAPTAPAAQTGMHDALLDMSMPLVVSLGRVNITLEHAFQLTTGALLELGCTADDPAELMVNGIPFARGHVVIVNGNYGLQITQLLQRPGSVPEGARKGAAAAV
jgi:flagellar motor switch protein FliN/FliY